MDDFLPPPPPPHPSCYDTNFRVSSPLPPPPPPPDYDQEEGLSSSPPPPPPPDYDIEEMRRSRDNSNIGRRSSQTGITEERRPYEMDIQNEAKGMSKEFPYQRSIKQPNSQDAFYLPHKSKTSQEIGKYNTMSGSSSAKTKAISRRTSATSYDRRASQTSLQSHPQDIHSLQYFRRRSSSVRSSSIFHPLETGSDLSKDGSSMELAFNSANFYGTLSRKQRKSFEMFCGTQDPKVNSFGTIRRRMPNVTKTSKDDALQYVEFSKKRRGSKASKEIRIDQNTSYTTPFLEEG